MSKLTLLLTTLCLSFTFVCSAMEICTEGDDLHVGDYIDLGEGQD